MQPNNTVRVLAGQITIGERDQGPRECSGEANADLPLKELVAGRLRKAPPTAERARSRKTPKEVRISDTKSSAALAFSAVPADVAVYQEGSGARSIACFIERRRDGRLWVIDVRGETPVELVRAFPWTAPTRYLSLRDASGEERAFVSDLRVLDAASRTALEAALAQAGFVLDIVRVDSVEEDFELRTFVVETEHGPRRFQTPLDAWPREVPDGALVLQDVYGDLYRIRDARRLDPKSRELLWAFAD